MPISHLWSNLVEWCEEQRELMIHQNEMMESGKMVDETPHWIEENKRRIDELEKLLADIAAGRF
jgi:hypothetical protein